MSTGDGKTKELDDKERSVYKLSPDEMYVTVLIALPWTRVE